MRKIFKSIFAVLAISLSISGFATAFAEGPAGYTDYGSTEYDGLVIGYDTSTRGNWLSEDNKYLGGVMDAERKYGTAAYYLPMAKNLSSTLPINQNHLVGFNATHQETWAESISTGFGSEAGSVVESFEIGGYAPAIYLNGEQNNTATSVNLQVPQLSVGSLDQYMRKDIYFTSDFGLLVQFNMTDPNKEYVFTTYFDGKLEDYRVALFNGDISTRVPSCVRNDKSYNGSKYTYINEQFLLTAVSTAVNGGANADPNAIPDEYVDITDYQAKNGVYVSFKVKGNFAVIIGCKTDYTRQTLYGHNAGVRGFFFDELKTEEPSTISELYSKLNQRIINFSWTNTDVTSSTVVLRKLVGEGNPWVPIAVLGKGIGSFTDNTVDSGSSYQYAFGVRKGGQYKDFLMINNTFVTNAEYTSNTLTLTPADNVTVNVGDTVRISATLKNFENNPVVGENVYLTLEDGRYIGTFIPDTTYTATTNSRGNATFNIPMNYSNYEDLTGFWHYTVTVKTEYNDVMKYNPVVATTNVTVKATDTQLGEGPVVTELSDLIKPGDILNVSGANLYELQGIKVYLTPAVAEPFYNESTAIKLDIIQYDPSGAFLNAKVPDNLDPGLYDVWVVTNAGVISAANGNASRVNAPRLFWISQDNIFEGLNLQITGINFMPTAYGAVDNSGVAVRFINKKGVEYLQPIVSLNSYMVEITCNDLPVGEYDVQVTTDGGITWSNVPNEQTLTVVMKSPDPLGLGVAWVNRFNWDTTINASDYGAIANDGKDDSLAIWRAIDAVKALGGGIVYLPEGTYHANNINLYNGVVILGAGKDKTKILYNGVGGDYLFTSGTNCTGECGIANVSISIVDSRILPDQYFQVGDQWGAGTQNNNLRVSNCIFIKAVDIDSPENIATSSYIKRDGTTAHYRGLAAVAIMDKYFLVEDCTWIGASCTVYRAYINGYMTMRNNYFVFTAGCLVATASYTIGTGNTLIGHHEYFDGTSRDYDQHGFFHRDRIYIAGNYIKDTGTCYNDGESICAEPISASYAYGRMLGTGIDTEKYSNTSGTYEGRRWMELGCDNPIRDITYGVFSRMRLAITGGTGVGQVRYIDASIPLTDSPNGNVVYLAPYEKDWDVAPDATSTYSLLHSVEHVIIYNNRVYDSTKGILMYGQFHDSVVADNYMEETEGISLWGAEVVSTNRFNLNYRILMINNICVGTGKTGVVSIGCTMNYNQGIIYNSNVQTFHVEIRNNYIYGDDAYTQYSPTSYYKDMQNGQYMRQRRANASSETHCMDGLVLYVIGQSTTNMLDLLPQKMYNIVFNNNTVENTYNGIFIGNMQIKGVLVNDSTFIKVRVPHGFADGVTNSSKPQWQETLTNIIIDRNEKIYASRDVFLADNDTLDLIKPIWAESRLSMLKVGNNKAMVMWAAAEDNNGIDHYEVYVNGALYKDNCEVTSIVLSGVVNSVAVYAVDKAGNKSETPLVAGNKVVIAGTTSVGALILGVNNSISYYAQLTAYNSISNIKLKVNYDKLKLNYTDSELLVEGSYSVDASKSGELVYDIALSGEYNGDVTSVIKANFSIKNAGILTVNDHIDFVMSDVEIKNGTTDFDYDMTNAGLTVVALMDKTLALDFNGDGKLSTSDYNRVVSAFGITKYDDAWVNAAEYDINGDGAVDIEDLMLVYYNLK